MRFFLFHLFSLFFFFIIILFLLFLLLFGRDRNLRKLFRKTSQDASSADNIRSQHDDLISALFLSQTAFSPPYNPLQLSNRRHFHVRHASDHHHQRDFLPHSVLSQRRSQFLPILLHTHRQQLLNLRAHAVLQQNRLHQPSRQRRIAARDVAHVAHVHPGHSVLLQPHARANGGEVPSGLLRDQQSFDEESGRCLPSF